MNRKVGIAAVLLCVVSLTMGFASGQQGGAKKLKVGSVIMNTSGEWFAEIIKGMQGAAKDLNVDISIVSSDNEVSKEANNVDTFISQGVNALCISPLSADASVAAIETARAAKIPVINWNTTVNTTTNGFVGVSNYELGAMTGNYVVEYVRTNFPNGCTMALLTNSSYEVGVERCNGFKEAIAKEPSIRVIASQDAELLNEGLDVTEKIFTANPNIDIIWAWNQTSLLGCISALQNAKNSKTVIMGTDMSVEIARVMQGNSVNLQAVTTQMPYDIGYNAVLNAVKAANGESVNQKMLIELKTYKKANTAEIQKYIDEHKDLVG
jgi:ABC-type sugar transport system substrate-binding protein